MDIIFNLSQNNVFIVYLIVYFKISKVKLHNNLNLDK